MNLFILIPFAVVVILLVVFLVKRNQNDETRLEDQIKNDYRKTKDEEGDIDIEENR
jgi:sensor domain CHASE-containing protein